MSLDRESLELEVRRLCQGGSEGRAAEAAIRGYGPEILGFLTATLRSEAAADDVFSLWSERLFRGIAGFGWECSLRTWAYTIARNTSRNYERDRRARQRHDAPLPASEAISRIAAAVRTETRPYLRTEAKSKLAELRDALPPDDQALLVLRLDKGLEWKDVARVMLGDDTQVEAAALTRESQRLRKRFQIVKDDLVTAARRAGILGDEG